MKFKLISLSLAILALASCSQTELIDNNASMQGMIDYSLYTQRGTRAVELNNTNFGKFKIHSYQNIEDSNTPGTFNFSPYYDETVEKGAGSWSGPRPRRWPTGASDFLNFYAYSDEANTNSSYTAATGVNVHPSFTYTVPTTAANQQDLLVAAAFNQTEKTNQGKLNLDFKHALTQIAFKVKSASPNFTVKVSKVELIGANSEATFTYDGTVNVVGAWSNAGTPAEYAFTVGTPDNIDNTDFVALAAAATEGNLMMIPNADPKDVTLRVTYTLNNDDPADPTKVLTKELKLEKESAVAGPNQTPTTPVTPWVMGKKVTYNLTLPGRAYEIIFGDATLTEDWEAVEEEENVEAKDVFGVSFVSADGFRNTKGFPLEINDNRGTAGTFSLDSEAAWVKFSETENNYAGATAALNNIAAATRAIDMSKKKTIYVYTDNNTTGAERKAIITMTRADYSTVTIEVIQTVAEAKDAELSGANCYIINEANTYALDATIKGNGKQVTLPTGYDAVANPAADVPVNIADVNITGATKAEVLWETANTSTAPAKGAIVKDVVFVNGVVFFTTTATEGNAVIVVKDRNGKILWNWHIWRTGATIEAKELAPITAKTGTTFADGSTTISGLKIMDRNLGALSATPQSDLSAGLHYQWGRPVPFPGATTISTSAIFMAVQGTAVTNSVGGSAITSVAAEANPTIFYINNTGASDADWVKRNDNLWGTPLTTIVTVNNGTDDYNFNANVGQKTIYDPCPKGWRVAPNYTYANASIATAGSFNKGAGFSILTAGTLWFPASGYRAGIDGSIGAVNVNGYCWNSSPIKKESNVGGGYLFFNANGVVPPGNGSSRTAGFPTRCIQE